MNKEVEIIKKGILETLNKMNIPVKRIILFGSRARGEDTKYSDYDLLIITEKTLTFGEKRGISKKLRVNLAKFAVDIIIKSEEEAEVLRNEIGTVVKEALKEGIVL